MKCCCEERAQAEEGFKRQNRLSLLKQHTPDLFNVCLMFDVWKEFEQTFQVKYLIFVQILSKPHIQQG